MSLCSHFSGVASVELLVDSASDVNSLLSTMGMPGTLENLEVSGQLEPQATLWQHALDSLFENSLWDSLI